MDTNKKITLSNFIKILKWISCLFLFAGYGMKTESETEWFHFVL